MSPWCPRESTWSFQLVCVCLALILAGPATTVLAGDSSPAGTVFGWRENPLAKAEETRSPEPAAPSADAGKKHTEPSFAPEILAWQTTNGARVLFVQAMELPMIDIKVVFDGGAARDGDKKGVAALTNGLLIEGAGDWDAKQLADRFDSVGARYGNSSHHDMTIVSLRSLVDPKLLETALSTFATVLSQPTFPADAFERDRRNTLLTLQQEQESPGDIANRQFDKAVFGAHPYASQAIGNIESVKSLTLDDVKAHYRRYYVARNAVIAMVGAVDETQARNIAERLTAGLDAGEAAPDLPPVKDLEEAVEIRTPHPSAQTHILVGQPGIRRGDPDYFPLYVGNHILGGNGLVSRLAETIREQRGLSYSTYSYFSPMRRRGPFIMGLQTRNDQAGEALNLLRKELRRFIDQGPSEKELDDAVKNITGGFPLRLASNKKIADHLAVIGFYRLPLDYLATFNRKVRAVTVAQIKDAFQRRIHPDKMVTVIVGGTTAAQQTRRRHSLDASS